MTSELGPEVRVLEGSWGHRLLGVGVGGGLVAVGAAIVAAGHASEWSRIVLFGGLLAVAGLIVGAITLRSVDDRVTLHGDGFVRRSRVLGDKAVRFDAITAIRAQPPAPAELGALQIEAGDVLVTIHRGVVSDLGAFVRTLEERSGRKLA